MVTTTTSIWELIPDIIGDGVSDQEEIMMAICEAKGAAFDGTDCVGELNDSTFYVRFVQLHTSCHVCLIALVILLSMSQQLCVRFSNRF